MPKSEPLSLRHLDAAIENLRNSPMNYLRETLIIAPWERQLMDVFFSRLREQEQRTDKIPIEEYIDSHARK